MTLAQKKEALETEKCALLDLLEQAPDYGGIGAEFHFKAGVLIRTTTRTEKTELVDGVQSD